MVAHLPWLPAPLSQGRPTVDRSYAEWQGGGMSRTDIDTWTPLTSGDDDSAGRAHGRLTLLMQRDPIVSMLSERAYMNLAHAIFSPLGLGQDSLPETFDESAIVTTVHDVLDLSPLQLLGADFRWHLAGLVVVAILGRETSTETRKRLGLATPAKV